jgi:hypothetical protein
MHAKDLEFGFFFCRNYLIYNLKSIAYITAAKRGIVTVNAIFRPLYYESTTTEFPSDPNLFFLEEELHSGAEMKPGLSFLRTISGDAFLPRAEAEALPFSSNELMQILNRLSIPLDSQRAKEVEVTLHDCEAPAAAAAAGERKYCATSLESMIDFVTSELKTRDIEVAATTTSLQHGGGTEQAQHDYYYRIAPSGPRKMPGENLVACHPEPYPHAVYYCHRTGATKAYAVPLVGKAATTVTAVAACHSDTKNWNPIFFKVLKVKPGTVLCHFLPQDHIIWTPSH